MGCKYFRPQGKTCKIGQNVTSKFHLLSKARYQVHTTLLYGNSSFWTFIHWKRTPHHIGYTLQSTFFRWEVPTVPASHRSHAPFLYTTTPERLVWHVKDTKYYCTLNTFNQEQMWALVPPKDKLDLGTIYSTVTLQYCSMYLLMYHY